MLSRSPSFRVFPLLVRSLASIAPSRPKLPYVNGYLVDTRRGEREFVEYFNPANGSRPFRIEVADEYDVDLVTQHITESFVNSCPMFVYHGVTYEEAEPNFRAIVSSMLCKRVTFLGFDKDKLAAIGLADLLRRDEFASMFKHDLHHEKPCFELKPDYTHEIDVGMYASRRMNQIAAIIDEAVTQTGKFLPKDVDQLTVGECLAVHKSYLGSGLATRLCDHHFDVCRQMGTDYYISHCVVRATADILLKGGMSLLFEVPYNQFRDRGEPVFGVLSDGATGIKVCGGYISQFQSKNKVS